MRNISDIIEAHLKKIIENSNQNAIEIKRSEIAESFQCVPSQINYVIKTRFTVEKGYIVESKRGGGGYIRISRIKHQDKMKLLNELGLLIHPRITQQGAIDVIERLLDEDLVSEREARLMVSAISKEVLAVPLTIRDELRSRILSSMISVLRYKD